MKKRKIYIIQAHTGTIPAKVIRVVTRYKYSHVMISLEPDFSKMYSFGRRTLNNPLNSGFIIETINGKFFKKYNNTECKVYKLTVDEDKYLVLKQILEEYENNPGAYQYDIIGLILRFFKIRIRRKNHYVCSQFVAEVIDKSYIYKFKKPIESIEPKDFEYIPNKEVAYIGKLKEYNV